MHLLFLPRFLCLLCLSLGLSGELRAETNLEKAARLIKAKSFPQAQVVLDQSVQSDPRNAEGWYLLGVLQGATQNDRKAVECADKAIQINPGKADYHILRGKSLGRLAQKPSNLFRALGLASDGLGALEKAVQLEPGNRNAILALFNWYHNVPGIGGGSLDKAKALAERTQTMDPSRGHFLKGKILDKQKNPAAAQAEYRLAIQEDPQYAEAYLELGYVELEMKQVDLALAHFRKLAEVDPGNANSFDSLGDGWMAKGNLDEAIKAYHKALSLDPLFFPSMSSLGKALVQAGRRDEAITFYRQCAQLGGEKGIPDVVREAEKRLKALGVKA
jgi:tetratricopeptide (TPR) repeat protein